MLPIGVVRGVFRKLLLALGIVAAIGVAYALWPRQAHLRNFDPATVACLETNLWRDYYEKKYIAIFASLYSLGRDQYGFSPGDSARLAWYAARAAKVFQPTVSREDAQRALPILELYYAVVRRSGGEHFDVQAAARRELEWWQLRRENATPAAYGQAIAEVTAVLFGVTNAEVNQSALLRADAMAYRDVRGKKGMETQDWTRIEEVLARSYELLKTGFNP